MRRRSMLVAAVTALLALPGAASAATCNLVTDKANDAYVGHPAAGVSSKPLDIRSLDVATGKKTLVVVLRVATTKSADDPATAAGMAWDVSFKIAGADYRFSRRVGPGGNVVSEGGNGNGSAVSGVKVAVSGTSITWTVPRSAIPKLKKRGAVFTHFFGGTTTTGLGYDQAPNGGVVSPARYVDGTKSCVKAA
ncbi:MAG TPA: hypothetical protein VNQ77_01490 [Frankiaceae bacterium]|nr:hypothetical protein [Frankiaceae bacterium]